MQKLGAALLVLFAAFDLGCSSNTSTSQADCQTFIETSYCPRVVACYTPAIDQATCLSMATSTMGLDCSMVTGENGDPKTCMTDIMNTDCATFVVDGNIVLPASCHGLFQLNSP